MKFNIMMLVIRLKKLKVEREQQIKVAAELKMKLKPKSTHKNPKMFLKKNR